MRILVNGAGGFIGSNLVRQLALAGHCVRASDLPAVDLGWAKALGAEVESAALLDAAAIERSLKDVDVVVHSAAIFDLSVPADEIMRVNTEGTRNYCKAAVKQGVKRLVQFSTVGVYGVPAEPKIAESGKKRPRNAYERSKWESEKIAMGYHGKNGLRIAAVRPTLVYGPGSRYGQAMYLTLFSCLRAWGLDSLPLPAGGKLTHHVHVDDVCSAVRVLIEAGDDAYGRPYNIADTAPLSSESVMAFLCREMAMDVRWLPERTNAAVGPLFRWGQPVLRSYLQDLNTRMEKTWKGLIERQGLKPALKPKFDEGWLDYLWADHSFSTAALQGIGWRPTVKSFLQGMPRTIDWYRAERWLPSRGQLNDEALRRQQRRSKSRRS